MVILDHSTLPRVTKNASCLRSRWSGGDALCGSAQKRATFQRDAARRPVTRFAQAPLPRLSDPEQAAESPGCEERRRTIMVHEDVVETPVGKEGATELSDVRRCLYPA